MDPFNVLALIVTLTAGLAYLNHRFVRLPMTIGLMAMALTMSLGFALLKRAGMDVHTPVEELVRGLDFSHLLLDGLLGVLLFAGALHINLNDLSRRWVEIGVFSTLGVALSTLLVGAATWGISSLLDLGLRSIECFLFGALISPTDPIAVLGLLKRVGVSKSLETKIAGESLFNDGIGVVVFLVLLQVAYGGTEVTAWQVLQLFTVEALGGALFGIVAGYAAYRMLKGVDKYQVEILVTLALVLGGYALANAIHLSAPIAMVVAGLLIGNQGRRLAMSDATREHLDTFWELLDEMANAVLFVLIGLEVVVLTFRGDFLLAGVLAIAASLTARLVCIGLPVGFLKRWRKFSPGVVRIMTWAGLRGGISVALALALPLSPAREAVLVMTYTVVVFSILVQGLTLPVLVRRAVGGP